MGAFYGITNDKSALLNGSALNRTVTAGYDCLTQNDTDKLYSTYKISKDVLLHTNNSISFIADGDDFFDKYNVSDTFGARMQ